MLEFAYCGYNGINFSDARQAAFVRKVKEAGFTCRVFDTGKSDVKDFGENVVRGERYAPMASEARAIRNWLQPLVYRNINNFPDASDVARPPRTCCKGDGALATS